jgi:hypothetical protein
VADVTGVFKADFSDFYGAVEKAESKLVEFEDDANKVQKSLNKMTDAFSGKKMVQDATLAAKAIEDLGGVTKLTANELARAKAQAQEAAEKLRKMGEEVPPELEKLATAMENVGDETADAAKQTNGLYQDYKSFDDVLDVAGVNVNKQVKALSQLKDMMGQNVGSMSKFSIAGAAVAAFMAGWEFGKWIDGWLGISDGIQKATESFMGWEKETKGGAGSMQDTLDRASAIAKRTVKDFTEAQIIIRGEIDKTQAVFLRADAPKRAAEMLAKYKDEITRLAREGLLDDLKKALEEGVIPQAELARLYKVSGEALGILNTQIDEHTKRQDRINAANEKTVQLQNQIFGRDLISRAQEYARALGDASNVKLLTPEAQADMNKAAIAALEHLQRIGRGASEAAAEMRTLVLETTNWAAINKAVAESPNPFAKSEQARRERLRSSGVADMNAAMAGGQGITLDDAAIAARTYWSTAGEEAEKAQAQFYAARDAEKSVAEQATATAQANNVLAGSFSVVTKSAAEWRDQAARLYEDAARMENTTDPRAAGAGSWYSQYIRNLRSGAQHAESSASYEDKIAGQGQWGQWGGGGWTVHVNAMQGINGDQIANELVAGMRRRGISPGA